MSVSNLAKLLILTLQVYKVDQAKFLFQDKYYGRKLNPLSFRETLAEYLDNGLGCQIRHIPVIIRKLRLLARIIRSLEDYRFYASSLLMIYDGDPQSQRKIDVRIIDFAHCVTQEEVRQHCHEFSFPPCRSGGPDHGYLLGLKSLTVCFEWIYKKHGGSLQDLESKEDDDIFEGVETPDALLHADDDS